MRLAEALVLRADCQRKISQLKQRLERSAKVQDGEKAPEDPKLLFKELNSTIQELTVLVKKINRTNCLTNFDDQKSILEALAEKDAISMERDVLEELIEKAAVKYDRYSRSEVKFVSNINIAEIQKQKDELSKRYRELDFKIQEKNWSSDLIEN
ncbi:DIP1984 family protein [Clostridium sp. PL3]|uniref:DIP1984 family protein n=1 Tax=Clostridium thailandense TaxID=2794346 RepID=A0A949WX64_9CLOT|nr:DIP1984 family protein [Clostridium thailandense]MBV7275602.1 DIP1984 family protein [Clostridium thailandense]